MRNLFNMDNPLFQALGKLADLMILNLVFMICCIPVVTIGASLTGLNYVALKLAEKEEGYIVKGFFKSFRQNFRQATIIWLIILAVGILLGLDLYILSAGSGTVVTVMRVLITAIAIVFLMIYTYVFPVLARFENSIKGTLRNAFIMAIVDFPRTIVMVLIPAAAVIVTFINGYTISYGLLIWILGGFALVAYANCFFMKKVVAKYMPKDTEESDPDEWNVDETLPEEKSEEEFAEETKAVPEFTDTEGSAEE